MAARRRFMELYREVNQIRLDQPFYWEFDHDEDARRDRRRWAAITLAATTGHRDNDERWLNAASDWMEGRIGSREYYEQRRSRQSRGNRPPMVGQVEWSVPDGKENRPPTRGSGLVPLQGVWLFFNEEDVSPVDEHRPGSKRTDPPLRGIRPGDGDVPYITRGTEKRSDGEYEVTTCSFYYKDNPAIGIGWELNPKSRSLGYHPHDIEYVSIYYQNGYPYTPKKVYYSTHGLTEGHWRAYEDCEVRNGFLVVYVARNSHACYPDNGNRGEHKRVYGMANDYTSTKGPNRQYRFDTMTPSFDANLDGRILYKGLRPAPPDTVMGDRVRNSIRKTVRLFGKTFRV